MFTGRWGVLARHCAQRAHFEGKIWRTLPLLAWRPGELTRRYVEGERARFVSPMALFLFSVFLLFAVFSAIGGPLYSPGGADADTSAEQREEVRREFEEERAQSVAKLAGLRQERARLAAAGQPTAEADLDISNAERALALEEQLFRQTLSLIDAEEKSEVEAAKAEEPNRGPARRLRNRPMRRISSWFRGPIPSTNGSIQPIARLRRTRRC